MDVCAGLTDREPEILFVPLHAPLAVHVLAPDDFQVITLVPPDAMEAGDAVNVTETGVLRVKFPVALILLEGALVESSEPLPPHADRANKRSNGIGRRFIMTLTLKNFQKIKKVMSYVFDFLKAYNNNR